MVIYLPLLAGHGIISEGEKKSLSKAKLCKMGGIDTRDFLAPGKEDNTIYNGKNSKRKKCVLISSIQSL